MNARQYINLNNGLKMPSIGVGTVGAMDEQEIDKVVDLALEIGYRHIDTAYVYNNEAHIGKALKKWFDSGKLKREDLFVTTKLPMFGVHPERAQNFIDKSLQNLQLDYVDLYLIHFPVGTKYTENQNWVVSANGEVELEGPTDHLAIWKKLEELVDQGKVKSIGLSNYNISQIESILKGARIKPANLQVEMHIYYQQPELREFCEKNGISIVAYAPLGSPNFNDRIMKRSPNLKELPPLPDLFNDPTVLRIGKNHNKTTAQILIRFLIQLGTVPIPKSSNPKRLQENFDVFNFALDDKEMQELIRLDKGLKIGDARLIVKGLDKHPDYPY